MVEKIKVSLWEIFSFFLSGLLAVAVALIVVQHSNPAAVREAGQQLSTIPSSAALLVGGLLLTLAGMLLEPPANVLYRTVLRPAIRKILRKRYAESNEETVLRDVVCEHVLGTVGKKLDSPYQLCKDYVELKQLSPTFMVFLARFGFYRNCAFISIAAGAFLICSSQSPWERVVVTVATLAIALLFASRAEDFYAYQAPAVYRALVIDKLLSTKLGRSE